ncbi:DUF2585 family protein [Pseudodonghicola flavimaris]|uniref:DUF2585 family protein n=1 Tax=Pseudodonghicola flavimaris TaxID=3050036 RepID=A0ABT7F6R5_9RHOB|nr:DUF2585 family protein [Pseudodonghicola flavimaris]MDK3020288.1 DUF2585 family protein [Pseudodonghicola flavimaris]
MLQSSRRPGSLSFAFLLAAIVAATALCLWAMGRNLICPCGHVAIWYAPGDPGPSSQSLFDWYTPSHLLHGLLFYAALWWVARNWSLDRRLVVALLVECAWEIVENTPWIIERYRSATVSVTYNGDAVINSVCDILAMLLGFALARRLPVWASVAVVLGFELLTTWLIRDGLALNILMLLWPLPAVVDWQAAV